MWIASGPSVYKWPTKDVYWKGMRWGEKGHYYPSTPLFFFSLFFFFFCFIYPLWEIQVALLGQGYSSCESSAAHSCQCMQYFHVSKPRHGCQCLGSSPCTQMLMSAISHGGCADTVRESALNVESGRKIPCCTGELNLPQQRVGSMLYRQLYITAPATSPPHGPHV